MDFGIHIKTWVLDLHNIPLCPARREGREGGASTGTDRTSRCVGGYDKVAYPETTTCRNQYPPKTEKQMCIKFVHQSCPQKSTTLAYTTPTLCMLVLQFPSSPALHILHSSSHPIINDKSRVDDSPISLK